MTIINLLIEGKWRTHELRISHVIMWYIYLYINHGVWLWSIQYTVHCIRCVIFNTISVQHITWMIYRFLYMIHIDPLRYTHVFLFSNEAVRLPITRLSHLKNIERHTVHTIVVWPNPKQWLIVHTSDLMHDDNKTNYIYILSRSSQMEWVNWKHTAPHIV